MVAGTSATRAVRRLGWFVPHPEGRVDIRSGPPLSAEIWAEFEEMVAVITDLRPFVIDYVSLENDYLVLSGVEEDIAADLRSMVNPFAFSGIQLTIVWAKAQGALLNFLATASALRDRFKMRLRKRYGAKSSELKELEATMPGANTGPFEHRLLYHLRHYGQHHESPLSGIPTKAVRQASGEMDVSISLVLRPKEMIPMFRSKDYKGFCQELSEQPDEIRLMPLVEEYFRLHGWIMKTIIDLHLPRLIQFQNYGRAVLTQLKIPRGAVPVIWEGEDPRQPSSLSHFSFDEFAFVHQLNQRLSKPPPA